MCVWCGPAGKQRPWGESESPAPASKGDVCAEMDPG
jgi:hypothetical protein